MVLNCEYFVVVEEIEVQGGVLGEVIGIIGSLELVEYYEKVF